MNPTETNFFNHKEGFKNQEFTGGTYGGYSYANAPKKATGQYVNTYRAKIPAGNTPASINSAIASLQRELSTLQNDKYGKMSTSRQLSNLLVPFIGIGMAKTANDKARDNAARQQAVSALISEYQDLLALKQQEIEDKAAATAEAAAQKKADLEAARQEKIQGLKDQIAAQKQMNDLAQQGADMPPYVPSGDGSTGGSFASLASGGTGKLLIYGGIAVAGVIMVISLMRRGNHPVQPVK